MSVVPVTYLGFSHGAGRIHQAFVVWLPEGRDLLQSLLRLAAVGFCCPDCGRAWPFLRPRGTVASLSHHAAFRVAKVSDSCAGCGAIVHWDRTPAHRHGRLKWVHLYERDPRVMGDRPSQFLEVPRG